MYHLLSSGMKGGDTSSPHSTILNCTKKLLHMIYKNSIIKIKVSIGRTKRPRKQKEQNLWAVQR